MRAILVIIVSYVCLQQIVAFVDKLSEDPVLTQKIAENINSHLLKQHDSAISHTVTSLVSHTVTSVDSAVSQSLTTCAELAVTSAVDAVNQTVTSSAQTRSTTSTADLSINEDSLMSALQVSVTSH